MTMCGSYQRTAVVCWGRLSSNLPMLVPCLPQHARLACIIAIRGSACSQQPVRLPTAQVRATNMGRHGGPKIDTAILRQVEHADLIHYGLIPEFVGRLPVIVSLQVGGT